MTVYFIGAGPGAADLVTVRAQRIIAASPVCLYAGSLVPRELLAECPDGARVIDTARLSLDEIVALLIEADAAGQDVARLHSGIRRSSVRSPSRRAGSTPRASRTPWCLEFPRSPLRQRRSGGN